ncbi:MAG: coniferyl-alcohol dehydrogenase [Alphaproteobacteria bacterium]
MTGKVVVVTGGSSGMGAATVTRLLDAGHMVHMLDIKEAPDNSATVHLCDLSEQASIEDAVAALPDQIGSLINIAGIADAEERDKVVRVNFLGLRHLTEHLMPRIAQGGSVVHVASTAGLEWQRRLAPVSALLDTSSFEDGLAWCRDNQDQWIKDPYTFSKQCTVAYTYRAAGAGLARRVRVNCVSPGGVRTPLTPEFRRLMGDAQYEWSIGRVGRDAEPDEIAEVICYLAVGPCGWLNGVNIPVDGGATAGGLGGWSDPGDSPLAKAAAARRAARAKD